jgi:hypothetical protein
MKGYVPVFIDRIPLLHLYSCIIGANTNRWDNDVFPLSGVDVDFVSLNSLAVSTRI